MEMMKYIKQQNSKLFVDTVSVLIPILMWFTIALNIEIAKHIAILFVFVIISSVLVTIHWFIFIKKLKNTYETADDFINQQANYGIKVSKAIKETLENDYWNNNIWKVSFSRTIYFLSYIAHFENYEIATLQRQHNYLLVVAHENFLTVWAVVFVRFLIRL